MRAAITAELSRAVGRSMMASGLVNVVVYVVFSSAFSLRSENEERSSDGPGESERQ